MRAANEEPQVVVGELDSLSRERPSHHVDDVDLVLAGREQLRVVLRDVAREAFGRRETLPVERREARGVPLERDLVAPLLLHERSAPVEENRPQHRR